MGNPARQLHDLLSEWTPKERESAIQARGGSGEGDVTFWRSQGRAVGLLLEVDGLLAGLSAIEVDTSRFEAYIPTWYRGVFAPRHDWMTSPSGGRSGAPIDQPGLDALWALAHVLDAYNVSSGPGSHTLSELSAMLNEAEELVRAVDDLPQNERIYVLGLVAEARRVVADVESFGTAGIRRITAELGGEMVVVADRVRDASVGRKFMGLAKRLLYFFSASATGGAIQGVAQGMIEGS